MDLGRARLRKIGLNNLHCAVHPHHGVIWTDGKGIYLAPIQLEGHQVQNAASVKVGEFENVTSVHWSSSTNADSCHMCVVHQSNVTVWRVSGALPKLIFKQVRKINVRPVPQGCLWNPRSDVLCLLSRHQCSFYFRHDMNKANYAFPALESSSIACGCWSPDGTKLILCVGAALLIYRWSDVNAAIDDFSATAWRIPGLEGKLTSIAPVLKDSVVVAAEVPLESLCKQQDVFKLPDALGDSQTNSDGVIRPSKSSSATESLLNLQPNTQAVTDSRSSLTMIHLPDGSHDPIKLSTVPLKGAMTPDVLMYERSSKCVVVGSNSQSQLHIYALLEKHLAYCGNIQLDKDQRPKGLCSMPTFFDDRGAALLILVGQREMVESALISPSTEADFRLSMKYIILKAGYNHHSRHNGRGDSIKERSDNSKSSSLIQSEKMKPHHVKNLSDSHIHKWSDRGSQDEQSPLGSPDEQKSPLRSPDEQKPSLMFPDEQKPHLRSPDEQKPHLRSPDEQKPHLRSPDEPIKILTSATDESLLESEELLMKPQVKNTIPKEKLIDDLSSNPSSHSESLEVETVSFSSQAPSFNNSKLSAEYSLDPVSNIRLIDQTDSSHSSIAKDIHLGEAARDDFDRKTDANSRPILSMETQSPSALKKYPKSDKMLKEDDNGESRSSQRQENCPGDTGSDVCHSQNTPCSFLPTHDNDKSVKFLENTSTFLHDKKDSFSPSLQSEVKPDILIHSQTKTESHNPFSSLESEIKHEIIVPSQIEPRNHFPSLLSEKNPEIIVPSQTEPCNHFPSLQSEIIVPSQIEPHNHIPSLQSEIKPEIIVPSQTEPRNYFSSLQSEIKPEIIVPSQTEPRNYFSSLQSEIKPEIIVPSQTEPRKHFPSLQSEIIIPSQTEPRKDFSSLQSEIIVPSQTEPRKHFPSLQSEIIIPSQIEPRKDFSSLKSEKNPDIIIPSQTKTESPNHFLGSQSELNPDITATLSKTKTDSLSHFSSLQTRTKPQTTTIPSHTAVDSSANLSCEETDLKPEISAISSETKTDSLHHFSSLQPKTKSTTTAIISQTETDPLSHFSSLQPKTQSPTTPDSFHDESGSPDHFYSLQSALLANSQEDSGELSDLRHSLRGRDLDHTKDDILSDLSHPLRGQDLDHTKDDILSDLSHPLRGQDLDHTNDDILSDLSHPLRGQDLDHTNDDILSDPGFCSSQHSPDSVWDILEKQTKSQKDSIDALHRRLELMSTAVDKTSCVFPTKYQDISKPEMVEISCEKPEGTETKKFLLDNGRLQLEPIKLAFGLATVELWLDDVPCVLGANIDGYIPLKFSSFTKLRISGRLMYR